MHFDWWTLGLQTVNFAILVWLMRRFLYEPVLRMLDARHAEIDSQYAEARAAESKANDRLASAEAEFRGIAKEREVTLRAAAAQAEEAAKARRAQAEAEAGTLLEEARKTLATERDSALAEARALALDLGADFARRLLAETPTKLQSEAWFERIEKYIEGLPKTEVNALVRQLGDGAGLTVATATPLASETAQTWRARLHGQLGDGIDIAFVTDPDLVAGAELCFPNANLRFSWRSALATARSEIKA